MELLLKTDVGEVKKVDRGEFYDYLVDVAKDSYGWKAVDPSFLASLSRITKVPVQLFLNSLYSGVAMDLVKLYAGETDEAWFAVNYDGDAPNYIAPGSKIGAFLDDEGLHHLSEHGQEVIKYSNCKYFRWFPAEETLPDGSNLCTVVVHTPFFEHTDIFYGVYTRMCRNGLVDWESKSKVQLAPTVATSDIIFTLMKSYGQIKQKAQLLVAELMATDIGKLELQQVKQLLLDIGLSKDLVDRIIKYMAALKLNHELALGMKADFPLLPTEVKSLWDLVFMVTYLAQLYSAAKLFSVQSKVWSWIKQRRYAYALQSQ